MYNLLKIQPYQNFEIAPLQILINSNQILLIFICQKNPKTMINFCLLEKAYLLIIGSKPVLAYGTSVVTVSKNVQFDDCLKIC